MTKVELLEWLDKQAELHLLGQKHRILLDEKGHEIARNANTCSTDGVHIYDIEKLIGMLSGKKFEFKKFVCGDSVNKTEISFMHNKVKFFGLSEKEVEYFV